jgi:hypothetical protein
MATMNVRLFFQTGAALGVVFACSAGGGGSKVAGSGGTSGGGGSGGKGGLNPGGFDGGIGGIPGGGGDIVIPKCSANCTDWPKDPVLDTDPAGAPPKNAPELFGAANNATPGAYCVLEPEAGSLFPANWLRPRFRFRPPAGIDVFEIRLTTPKEVNPLVLYTKRTDFTMPKEFWEGVANNVLEEDITVTIRGISAASPGTPQSAQTSFRIAPVRARGSMVYWATTSTNKGDQYAWLDGFSVGEEGVIEALRLAQVKFSPVLDQGGNVSGSEANQAQGHVDCIGCHTSTPDGDAVLFTEHWPWSNVIADVKQGAVGNVPSYVTPAGAAALKQAWLGRPSASDAYWSDQGRIVITSFGNTGETGWGTAPSNIGQSFSQQPEARLAWINLSAASGPAPAESGQELIKWVAGLRGTAYGFIERQGDSRGALMPDFSDDGQKIVYVSTSAGKDGRLGMGEADLYTVPYNAGAGGPATALPGAAASGVGEYYPAFSPDSKLIAFNRVGNLSAELYYNKDSEVHVIPAEGGTAERLKANDPPACLGATSPGIINSWPRWSPLALTVGARTYYWLIFSSAREPSMEIVGPDVKDKRGSQLYITAVVVEGGKITTYPAIYIWNQRRTTSNHTPAWDVFKIPPVPPPR